MFFLYLIYKQKRVLLFWTIFFKYFCVANNGWFLRLCKNKNCAFPLNESSSSTSNKNAYASTIKKSLRRCYYLIEQRFKISKYAIIEKSWKSSQNFRIYCIRSLIINHSFIITRSHRDFFKTNTAFRLIICHHQLKKIKIPIKAKKKLKAET